MQEEKVYIYETPQTMNETAPTQWYAIRTRNETRAEEVLADECAEVYCPKEEVRTPEGKLRTRVLIPRVLFIRTTRRHALELEEKSRQPDSGIAPLWIYRYVKGDEIQPIGEAQIHLLHLLTAPEPEKCEIFTKTDFRPGVTVRVTGGPYKGNVGTVQRVKKNKHVIVRIEGICMIMLPFIHPDLLEEIN